MRRAESLQHQAAKEFSRALKSAKRATASGKTELAVEWCRYAASAAWMANPGFFYCHEMEQLLAEIGRKYPKSPSVPRPPAETPLRFLHVMSTAYERGGHTRAVSRWIEICAQHAPSEHHSILISIQGDVPLPVWLRDSAERTGGELIKLPPSISWLQRATEIRSRSLEFDAIVLHHHPDDPLPNLAFYDQPRPVLFFNHADHVFSLGTDVAGVIADLRTVGHKFSVLYRSPAPRKVLLPLPLPDEEHTSWDKAEARKQLGLPADALIVLTIGEPYKFIPMPGCSFPEVVQSLCAKNSRLLVVAVGPSEFDPFPELKGLTGGRFMPAGFVKDRNILELYYFAADIYLDCIPWGSLTAVLDAAQRGLPVQRLANPYQSLLWVSDPALNSVVREASNPDELVAGVLEWLEWPEENRSELGSRFRTAVMRDHCGASWKFRWLDPVVGAMRVPREGQFATSQKAPDGEEDPFLALAGINWKTHWPASMLVAVCVLDTGGLPRRIRLSGLLHSIQPLLFDTAGDGMARKRLSIFTQLVGTVAPIVPNQIIAAVRRKFRAIFKKR
jgi:hypothetical protein